MNKDTGREVFQTFKNRYFLALLSFWLLAMPVLFVWSLDQLAPFGEIGNRVSHILWLGYGLVWCIGLGGMLFGVYRTRIQTLNRYRAEQAVRESNERLDFVLAGSNDGFWDLDLVTNQIRFNPRWAELLGYGAKQMRTYQRFREEQIHPEDAPVVALSMDAHLAGNTPQYESEYRLRTRVGEWRWVLDRGRVVASDASGKPVRMAGIFTDITERKQSEQEIQRRAEQLAALNDAALKIQQYLHPLEICSAACEELRHFGQVASAFRLTEDGMAVHIYTAMSTQLLGEYVDHFGRTPEEFSFSLAPLGDSFNRIRAGQTLMVYDLIPHITETRPAHVVSNLHWMCERSGCGPVLVAPLTQNHTMMGMIIVLGGDLRVTDIPAVSLFARQVSVALENARLLEAEQARRQELAALYDLSRAIADTDSLTEILSVVAHHSVETINATFSQVAILENDQLVIRAAHPHRVLGHDLGIGYAEPLAALPHCQQALKATAPMILRSTDPAINDNERRVFFLGLARTVTLFPLRVGDQVLGFLMLGEERSEEREPFDAEKMRLTSNIGDQAASAIHRARLREETERYALNLATAYDATIEGWSLAMDLRDKETEGHTQRVMQTTMRLARMFQFHEEHLVHIRRGALLHDIGKMGIPDSILLKPGALTDREWEIMRLHPVYAYELLSKIEYLRPALDIPYRHHEKWDGTGYPGQLKGEQIPLSARIFAIVDVWDALCSNRPYRAAWSRERAREYIEAQAGRHFDPQVVELFLKMEI